jgi:hypothetical protein
VAQLALDDVQWDSLARHLDRMRVAKLVRRKPATNARAGSPPVQVSAHGRAVPAAARTGSVNDAEQRADRELAAMV